jgi:ABC-2 type transport system ATP-binding protein
VECHALEVRYPAPHRRIPTFKEWLIRRLTAPWQSESYQALSGVGFTIARGGSLGVVGRNGAGKSTLLRVIAGILVPSAGHVVTRGRIAPIIELGTGFDQELSGRENIYFNGALLGRSRAEMRRRFNEVVDFAELAEFIESPLRTYSTGMVARLAFAVATAVDPQILLIDEVLSVGDERFRAKCESRIEEFRAAGSTFLLVSHDLSAVARLCDEALWLEGGRVVMQARAEEVAQAYRRWSKEGGGSPLVLTGTGT